MKTTLHCLMLFVLMTASASYTYADITDVNSIAELKTKKSGTYKYNIAEGTMVYSVYNDNYSGVYIYLWDGTEGLRVNGLYDGDIKEFVDNNPVGKEISGSITAAFSPDTPNGCTMICNATMTEGCSFDAVSGGESAIEPKDITIGELEAAASEGYSVDFAYVRIHGYVSFSNYAKYMFDDQGGKILISNTNSIVSVEDFNMANNNMDGKLQGAAIITRSRDRDNNVYIDCSVGIVSDDWFLSEGKHEAPAVNFDADGEYTNTTEYPLANATIDNLTMNAGCLTTISLPFAITKTQIESVFGEGTEIYSLKYSGNSSIGETTAVIDLTTFDYTYGMSASSVYAIKPAKDVDAPCFEEVQISGAAYEASSVYTDWNTTTYESLYFKGTFSRKELDAAKCLVLDTDGNLTKPAGAVKGFTGYFEVPERIAEAEGAILTIDGKGISTAIKGVADNRPETGEAVYNLNGQRIIKPSHGIYIRGGKKHIAR